MTVKERILTITLLEKMKQNPKLAKELGLEIKKKTTKNESSYYIERRTKI